MLLVDLLGMLLLFGDLALIEDARLNWLSFRSQRRRRGVAESNVERRRFTEPDFEVLEKLSGQHTETKEHQHECNKQKRDAVGVVENRGAHTEPDRRQHTDGGKHVLRNFVAHHLANRPRSGEPAARSSAPSQWTEPEC